MKCRGLFLESQHISFEMKGLEKTEVGFGPQIASRQVTVLAPSAEVFSALHGCRFSSLIQFAYTD